MKKKELYDNYLSKLEEALTQDNKENIDYIVETIYTMWLPEQDIEQIDDIMQEATLYLEFGEAEYKDEALKLISEFK